MWKEFGIIGDRGCNILTMFAVECQQSCGAVTVWCQVKHVGSPLSSSVVMWQLDNDGEDDISRPANASDFSGSLPFLRSTLRLYDLE